MLKSIIACTLALSIAAGVLCGAVALTAPETAESAVTLCDLDYREDSV